MNIFKFIILMVATTGCIAKKKEVLLYPEGTTEALSAHCINDGMNQSQCDCLVSALKKSSSWKDLRQGAIKKQRGAESKSYKSAINKAKAHCREKEGLKTHFIETCEKNAPNSFCKCAWEEIADQTTKDDIQIESSITAAAHSCVDNFDVEKEFMRSCIERSNSEAGCSCVYKGLLKAKDKKDLARAMIQLPWKKQAEWITSAVSQANQSCKK